MLAPNVRLASISCARSFQCPVKPAFNVKSALIVKPGLSKASSLWLTTSSPVIGHWASFYILCKTCSKSFVRSVSKSNIRSASKSHVKPAPIRHVNNVYVRPASKSNVRLCFQVPCQASFQTLSCHLPMLILLPSSCQLQCQFPSSRSRCPMVINICQWPIDH